jgi:hypothetical protein
MIKTVTRLLREPLLHFLLLGAALFAVWIWRKDAGGSESGRIVVTRARIDQLATGFARTWQRPPTAQELAGLVPDFVKEEVCVREATAMGLDRDDTIVRRRLRQKFEFLTEDAIEAATYTFRVKSATPRWPRPQRHGRGTDLPRHRHPPRALVMATSTAPRTIDSSSSRFCS